MAFGGRLISASRAGWDAFRREFSDPTDQGPDSPNDRRATFARLWSYYANTVYEDPVTWRQYRARYGLYRAQRSIYNPTRRLVEIYAGQLYPGVLSEDGKALPDGVPLAIPLTDDTAPELKTAIAQFWQWSNWQANKSLFVRYGAIAGSVMVEVVDNLERRNVTASVVWAGQVDHLDLDNTGNVKEYALEYRAYDEDSKEKYTYRKEVDSDSFRYYRDGHLYDYDGEGSEQPNPYGFVPAVWVRHSHTGSDWGAPAIEGSLNKIDELNALASHTHDQIHKKIAAPAVLAGVTSMRSLTDTAKRNAASASDYTGTEATVLEDREDLLLISAPAGTQVHSIAGTLELDDALPYLEKLLSEIEADHPELMLYRELRQMSQVTGPGAQRLMGDAYARIIEAQASYDMQSTKLFAMSVAIAGWRLGSGAWGGTDRQREKFRPFDLGSYQRGDLDLAIAPRPIMPSNQLERAMEEQAAATAVSTYVQAGMSLEMALQRVCGLNDEEMAEFTLNQTQAIQRAQLLAQSDVPADPVLAAVQQ